MKNFVLALTLCLFAVSLVGCGSKADRLVKKQIKLMNKMADELEAGKSRKDLKDLEDQMNEIGKEMNDLDLSKEEKDRLKEKYEDKLTDAMKRLMEAQFNETSLISPFPFNKFAFTCSLRNPTMI